MLLVQVDDLGYVEKLANQTTTVKHIKQCADMRAERQDPQSQIILHMIYVFRPLYHQLLQLPAHDISGLVKDCLLAQIQHVTLSDL